MAQTVGSVCGAVDVATSLTADVVLVAANVVTGAWSTGRVEVFIVVGASVGGGKKETLSVPVCPPRGGSLHSPEQSKHALSLYHTLLPSRNLYPAS